MHVDDALGLMAQLLWAAMLLCAPVLGVTLVVGLLVSLLQAVTQLQEMSLTFIPKLVAAGVALVAFGPWMLRTLVGFTTHLWAGIPHLV